jgi:hypothetical protein
MSELSKNVVRGRRRSIVRTNTVSGKFTDAEAKALRNRAAERGQLLGEWVREALLTAGCQQQDKENSSLFTEVLALRLLLINSLEPLLRGDKMTPEQFKEMLRYVKSNKRKAATDMLASYTEGTIERP